ncbi:MAG: DUF933 domain-containing protein [Planctomycetota bacterium]|nr:DUF933 domain-containing protein [Planctomycetota bacterium]
MNIALAGLPLAGKTCLFDALSEGAVDSAANPARPNHPNAASIAVPDERLDWLHDHYATPKKVPVHLEWIDLPGLLPGRSDLQAQNTAILEHLRRADALVYVLRAFESEKVPGRVDPEGDREALASEFLLSDLGVVERRIDKVESQMTKPLPNRDALQAERAFLGRCREALEAEQPLQGVPETEAERNILRNFAALTLKPALTVLNVDEGEAGRPEAVAAAHAHLPPPVRGLCASLEAEIRSLPLDEQADFLQEMGLDRLHATGLLAAVHKALDRITFYTTGEKEVAARSLARGATAVDAAGNVHTDMAHGFIRAEVVAFDHLAAAGDVKQAKADGHVRLEGRDYVVQDGDVIFFHFSR